MIHFYRSAAIAQGKFASALGFAKEISSYLKERHGLDAEVSVPIGGNPNRIAWAAAYPDLAAYEAAMMKLMADANYMEMTRKGAENFLPGSIRDQLWRAI